MSYLFYLDGTLYDNPADDRNLRTTIRRDQKLFGMVQTQDAKVRFQGAAYDYLYGVYWDGLCNEVECQIWSVCDDASYMVHDGVIKIADIIIDFQKCEIETTIEDNGFFSYINNNKNIKIPIGPESTSKSGVEIPQLQLYEVDFFDPCTGTLYGTNKPYAYRLYDVMQFVIDYITDGRFQVESDLLTGGENEIMITRGDAIRLASLGSPTAPEGIEVTFQDLYDAIQRIYNCAFRVEKGVNQYDRDVFRIETQDYFYKIEGGLTLEDVKDLKIRTDNREIYANITVGGADFDDEVTQTGPCPPTSNPKTVTTGIDEILNGWSKTDINIAGQCNTADRLDLGIRFQIASNVVEDVYALSDEFNNDNFLLEVENVDEGTLTCDMVANEFFNNGVFYYNIGFNNGNCLKRRSGYLHNSVVDYLDAAQTDQFKATKANEWLTANGQGWCVSQPTSVCSPTANPINASYGYIYNNTTAAGYFNNGGNYNTGTGQYTCPTDGNYTFTQHLPYTGNNLFYTPPPSQNVPGTWQYIKINAIIENTTTGQIISNQAIDIKDDIPSSVTLSQQVYCTAGDTIEAYFYIEFYTSQAGFAFGIEITNGSYFACESTPSAKGDLIFFDTSEYKAILMEFEYPLSGTIFRDIEEDPTQFVTITSNNTTFVGWFDNIQFNHQTARAEITLRTNAAIQDT